MEKGDVFKILDHGYVKLVDWMGGDESIIEAARMSTGSKGFISWDPYVRCLACGRSFKPNDVQPMDGCVHENLERAPNGDQGLLEFLLKNWHTTPFEMCELVIEVQAPIFVYREWHRHRTQSYNELSARYTQMPNLHYVPSVDRLKAVKSANKQEASVYAGYADPDTALDEIVAEQQRIYDNYEDMLKAGVPKEVARINTPVARYSRMRAKTDLLNWLKFLNLRMRPNAQWEIRQYANQVAKILDDRFPRTYQLFEEFWLYARSFSRTELRALNRMLEEFQATNMFMQSAKNAGLSEKKSHELLKKLITPADELLA